MNFMHLFFSLEGRINRAKWWLGAILLGVAINVIMWILMLAFGVGNIDPNQPPSAAMFIPIVLVIVLSIWPFICVYAKRWHDRDKSGWWTLILLVPIVGSIWLFVECGCLKGTEGPNRFGPDPLA